VGPRYAGALTAEVGRAVLAAGATEEVLHADPANATSNALYLRLGFAPVADFTVHHFAHAHTRGTPEAA
jgi:predicted GNAT family acetyltransferase